MSTWGADVYQHFERTPKILIHRSGKVLYAFKCQKKGYVHSKIIFIVVSISHYVLYSKLHGRVVKRNRNCTTTSNLRDHERRCTGRPDKPLLKYSRERLRLKLAQWCAKRGRPFALVDDDEFGK